MESKALKLFLPTGIFMALVFAASMVVTQAAELSAGISSVAVQASTVSWRDIALGLVFIVIYLMRKEMERKADQRALDDMARRIDAHHAEISTLFSKVNNEVEDRLKAHIEILTQQNANQQALLGPLAAIAKRAVDATRGSP